MSILNNASINASKVYEESNKRLESLEDTFAEMKNRYDKEKLAKTTKRIDPTNIKELIEQPV